MLINFPLSAALQVVLTLVLAVLAELVIFNLEFLHELVSGMSSNAMKMEMGLLAGTENVVMHLQSKIKVKLTCKTPAPFFQACANL